MMERIIEEAIRSWFSDNGDEISDIVGEKITEYVDDNLRDYVEDAIESRVTDYFNYYGFGEIADSFINAELDSIIN